MFVSPHLPYRRSGRQDKVLAALRSLLNLFQPFQTPRPTFVVVHSDAGHHCEEAEEGEDQREHNCHWGSPECVFSHRVGAVRRAGGGPAPVEACGATLRRGVWVVGVDSVGHSVRHEENVQTVLCGKRKSCARFLAYDVKYAGFDLGIGKHRSALSAWVDFLWSYRFPL